MAKRDSDNLIIIDEAHRVMRDTKKRGFWEMGRTSCPRQILAIDPGVKNGYVAAKRLPPGEYTATWVGSGTMPRIDFARLLPRPLCDYRAIERSELGRMETLYDLMWLRAKALRGFLTTAWGMLTLRGDS